MVSDKSQKNIPSKSAKADAEKIVKKTQQLSISGAKPVSRPITAPKHNDKLAHRKPRKCAMGGKEHERAKHLRYLSKNPKVRAIPSDKVKVIPPEELAKLNPYLRSVVGSSYLNLEAYGNNMNVFFAYENNPGIDEYLKASFEVEEPLPVISFNDTQIEILTQTLQIYTDFIGITLTPVENYEDSDFCFILCESFPDPAELATGTFPQQLVENPVAYSRLQLAFNNAYLNEYVLEPGSFYYETSLHEVGHCFGLAHPHDGGAESGVMPGTQDEQSVYNAGFYNMNLTSTTVMSYVEVIPDTIQKETTTYSRNLMCLDLQALRYIYKISNNSTYINNWTDLTCPIGHTQTLISTNTGITLNLSPSDNEGDNQFNLNLQRFCGNPLCDNENSYSVCSTSTIGYDPNTPYFTNNYLDKDSFIGKVFTAYPRLEVVTSTIVNNCQIIANSTAVENITLWVKCKKSNYQILRTENQLVVKNIKTGKAITVSQLTPAIEVEVFFSVNN